jgi:hypothetical protein
MNVIDTTAYSIDMDSQLGCFADEIGVQSGLHAGLISGSRFLVAHTK